MTQIVQPNEAAGTKRDKQRPVAHNWFRLGYLVHDVSRMRRTLYDQHLKPLGITRSQWWVLANISRQREQGVISSELARDIDVGKVAISGILDRLEIAGYVYRRSDPTDKRARRIFITDAGYELIRQMRAVIEPLNQRICSGLSEEQVYELEEGLSAVKINLKALLDESGGGETEADEASAPCRDRQD